MGRGTVNTETRLELTVGGPAAAGARLAGSFSGCAAWQSVEGPASRWSCKHTRQDVVPISHRLLGDLNFIP